MLPAQTSSAKGISAALGSALFLGLAPVFGRQAILAGIPSLAVVAIRTVSATLLLLLVTAIFFRRYLYIYPAGLLGCLMAGWINGVGSLFYYFALSRINANLGQMLYSLYPLFLALWLALDRQLPNRLTLMRLCLALPAIILLAKTDHSPVDLLGVGAMLVASMLYALHLPFNQRVLYDMPPQTVTLYTLLAMSSVVVPPFLLAGPGGIGGFIDLTRGMSVSTADILGLCSPLIGLTLVTFFSRLMLFTGVKHLGGMQTALLGLGELLVTLVFAHFWLQESFSLTQWLGAILLVATLMLVGLESAHVKKLASGGFLGWVRPAGQTDITPSD
jgi:drug/metabolite transporter (DMT)-like permease